MTAREQVRRITGRRLRHLPLLALMVVSGLAGRPAGAEEVRSLALSAGAFNVSKSDKAAEAGVELRLPTRAWKLVATVGGSLNEQGSFWLFAGLRRDFGLARGWQVTPGFGLSIYEAGDGKDLGGPLEFRSILELSYQWPSRYRLAAAFYHLSNAGIYELNPGSNSAILTLSVPLGSPD